MNTEDDDTTIALSDDDAEAVAELRHLRAERLDIKKREDELRDELLQLVGEADHAVTASGAPLLSVKRTVRTGVDRKALEAKYPDVFEDVMTETEVITLDLS